MKQDSLAFFQVFDEHGMKEYQYYLTHRASGSPFQNGRVCDMVMMYRYVSQWLP